MHIIYTAPHSPWGIFATLIRLFTKLKNQKLADTPSHMALVFPNKIVLEARGGGVRLTYLDHFTQKNRILCAFVRVEDGPNSDTRLRWALDKFYGKKYDFYAIFWWACFLLRYKLFGMDIPQMSKWQDKHDFYCSELFEISGINDYTYLDPNSQMLAAMKDPRLKRIK
jgi:hypothetical protein